MLDTQYIFIFRCLGVVFKNVVKSDIWVQNQTMNTLMKPIQFICGNIEFLEFSKFLSHMYYAFLRKLIKITVSAISNINSVIIL